MARVAKITKYDTEHLRKQLTPTVSSADSSSVRRAVGASIVKNGAILKRIKRHITYLVIKVYFFRDIVKNESADSAI